MKGESRYWKKSLGHNEEQKALVRSKIRRRLAGGEAEEKMKAWFCWMK